MEMKWWHTAHFALWGRADLLGHTNLWYVAALENATWYAGTQVRSSTKRFCAEIAMAIKDHSSFYSLHT